MATRRKAPARRTPARRRRMSSKVTPAKMNAAIMNTGKAALGGVLASIITNTVGKSIGSGEFGPYAGLAGSVITGLMLKQPEIAAGMAGYSGPKVLENLPGIGPLLEDNGGAFASVPGSMNLASGSDVYSSDYSLAGYEVPGL